MKSLYLRIWLTVVAALVLFALVSSWLWQRHLEQERARYESVAGERVAAWAELVQRSLPPIEAPRETQAEALREWSMRLRVPLALDDEQGRRIATADAFARREAEGAPSFAVRLDDGRTLRVARRMFRFGLGAPAAPVPITGAPQLPPPDARLAPGDPEFHPGPPRGDGPGAGAWRGPVDRTWWHGPLPPWLSFGLPPAFGPIALLAVLLVAVAAGAYPVVRRLTRRLEALKQGVATFGAGELGHRVDASGHDEVAAVATTFNHAAERIETLVRSHQSLLANASHELRSPLARLKMAVAMYADATPDARPALRREIETDIAELDALVEEVLLASRLDANAVERSDSVDLLGLAAEEAARVGADAGGETAIVAGSERLLRRALRNLIENARRYGGGDVEVSVARRAGGAEVRVCDRGSGVPEAYRERIFEPFFRLPGHAEREGGIGLGLSLVRQIAQRHGGQVRCEARAGGGSCFVLSLPAA